jgi:hypothetical protein
LKTTSNILLEQVALISFESQVVVASGFLDRDLFATVYKTLVGLIFGMLVGGLVWTGDRPCPAHPDRPDSDRAWQKASALGIYPAGLLHFV